MVGWIFDVLNRMSPVRARWFLIVLNFTTLAVLVCGFRWLFF